MVPDAPQLAFIYGSREVLWSGIVRGLFVDKGVIRDALIRCDQLIRERLGWSLQTVFTAQQFADEEVHESALTALQIALTEGIAI